MSQTRPKRAAAVLEQLKQCALQRRLITYSELATLVCSGPQNMGRPLGYIRDEVCLKHNRPRIDALAVRKRPPLPASGFFPDGVVNERWWREQVKQVCDYDWSNTHLED